ncbi:MAG: hypothetical protein JXQ27_18365 [Acidobacteria bacterium]|nr:hypothetical protein [Acidobacteriota bacterium]
MPEVLIILFALLGIVYYVCQPFFGKTAAAARSTGTEHDVAMRVLEESLANLEYDYRAGKIGEEDFLDMQSDLQHRLTECRDQARRPAAEPAKSKHRSTRTT